MVIPDTPVLTTGRIHSIESTGAVDGPGLRFVAFTQGCPLSCSYCHNADSRTTDGGKEWTAEELVKEALKYKSFMKNSGGGITLSGGEPLLQPDFTREVFRLCKENGIHTALDTSGYCGLEKAKSVFEYTDLVLLDIKAFDREIYRKVTKVSLAPTLKMAEYLSEIQKPVWLRVVVVPGLTDGLAMLEDLAKYAAFLGNVECVEIQPFHKLGEYKWEELEMEYDLKDTPPCSPSLAETIAEIFRKNGLKTI